MKFFYSIILAGIIVWLGSASFTYLPLLFRSGGLEVMISNLFNATLAIPIVSGAIAAVVLFRILNKNLIDRVSRKVTITSAGVFLAVSLFAMGLFYGCDGARFLQIATPSPSSSVLYWLYIASLAIPPIMFGLILVALYHAIPSRTSGSERKS